MNNHVSYYCYSPSENKKVLREYLNNSIKLIEDRNRIKSVARVYMCESFRLTNKDQLFSPMRKRITRSTDYSSNQIKLEPLKNKWVMCNEARLRNREKKLMPLFSNRERQSFLDKYNNII